MIEVSGITKKRIEEYLEQGKRFDNRKFNEFREIKIEQGVSKNAEGSARVKVGNTEVLVGIKMNVDAPYPDSPNEGNLMTTMELLPLSSPRFEGNGRFDAVELERVIDRGIRESKFIDFKKLCIKEGEKVWTVFIDIYTLNDDGNILDAAGIGAVAALKNAKIPKYDEENEKVLYGEWTENFLPLSEDIPISITAYNIGSSFIIDPNREEEDISKTRVTISSSNGTIFSIQKGESGEISIEEMENVLAIIEKTEREIFKKIEKHLKVK